MINIGFGWKENGSLAAKLSAPTIRASIRAASHGRPISLTLWHADAIGLRVQSTMHDVGKRLEVGILEFMTVHVALEDDLDFSLPAAFQSHIEVSKLVMCEKQFTAESGFVLETSGGEKIIVTAGAFPYALAIQGIAAVPHTFEPEYPLESYTVKTFAVL